MKLWKQLPDGAGERKLELVEDAAAAEAIRADLRETQVKLAIQRSSDSPAVALPLPDVKLAVESPAPAMPTASGASSPERRIETSLGAERDEIMRRVTAFRNLQIRIKRDREQYCDAVLARTRAALGHRANSPQ